MVLMRSEHMWEGTYPRVASLTFIDCPRDSRFVVRGAVENSTPRNTVYVSTSVRKLRQTFFFSLKRDFYPRLSSGLGMVLDMRKIVIVC